MANFKAATLVGPDGKRVEAKTKQEADRLFASNYTLETAAPTPTTTRTDDGGFQTSSLSPLSSYKNKTNFLGLLKDAIQKKQGMNKDIQSSRDYWRTQQRDTSSFEDKDFQLMSPAEQASVRTSRGAAASAHLQGIREEEEYRGTRLEDILSNTRDVMTDRDDAADRALINEQRRLNIVKSKEDLGYEPTATDIYGSQVEYGKRVDDRIGGSLSWRHNNPGNIKFGDFASGYGATQGQDATDGGAFAIFPDLESGQKAMADLLKGKNYANLSVDEAMKRWSNNGYGAEVWSGSDLSESKSMKDLSDAQRADLAQYMTKREGWKEGKTGATPKIDPIELTEASKAKLMQDSGLENRDVVNYTADDWLGLKKANRQAYLELAEEDAKEMYKDTDKTTEIVSAELIQEYGSILSATELNSVMTKAGFKKQGDFLSTWSR